MLKPLARSALRLWWLAALAVLVACSSGQDTAQPVIGPTPSSVTQTSEPASADDSEHVEAVPTEEVVDVAVTSTPQATVPTEQGSTTPTDNSSPLDLALGLETDPDELSSGYELAYEEHADRVTSCMRRAGFDYTYPQLTVPEPAEFLRGGRSTSALIGQYGYGPLTSARAQLNGRTTINSPVVSEGEPVSPGEREAFLDQKGSCLDIAANAIVLPDDLPIDVSELIDGLRSSIAESAAVQELWASWARCMGEAGLPYVDRGGISADLYSQSLVITAQLAALAPTEETPNSLFEQLDRLVAIESRIIDADVGCVEEHDLDSQLEALTHAAETEFLAENGDWITIELARWRSDE